MNNSLKPGRLRVGVVGAGRVGAVWGAALDAAGHEVIAASGISEASRTRIETLLPDAVVTEPDEVVARADLVVLGVTDDALAPVVRGLAEVGAWRSGQIAVHSSGLHGLDVYEPAAAHGVLGLALHPAMTFTGTSLDLTRMAGAVFAVTAPPATVPIGQALVVEMGGEPVVVEDQHRPLYHAALVHGANHVVTALTQASHLLSLAGIEEPGRLLGPLVHASVEGAVSEAPGAVTLLTGPVVRGDVGTIAAHVRALRELDTQRAAYVAMAQATADLALAGGRVGAATYAEIIAVLNADH